VSIKRGDLLLLGERNKDFLRDSGDERRDERPVDIIERLQLVKVDFVGPLASEEGVDRCATVNGSSEKGGLRSRWDVGNVLLGENRKRMEIGS